MKFGVDIQSPTKFTVRKPQAIWLPGSHYDNDIAEKPIYTSIVLLMFGVDIQSQTKSPEPKIFQIWPPGGHFQSDVAQNQKAPAFGHNQHRRETWNRNSKANFM